MFDWFLELEHSLYIKYGYNFVVHLEDFLLCASSLFLGALIMSIVSGNVILKIQKLPIDSNGKKIKKVKWVLLEDNQNTFIVEPNNIGEAVETVLVIAFKPLFTYKHYGIRDERRTKIFIVCLLILGIILTVFAFLSAVTVFDPKL